MLLNHFSTSGGPPIAPVGGAMKITAILGLSRGFHLSGINRDR